MNALREAAWEHRFHDGSRRDPDRETVYIAEGFVARRHGRRKISRDETSALAYLVQQRFETERIKVRFNYQMDYSFANHVGISMCEWGMKRSIVIHELAHVLQFRAIPDGLEREFAGHGRLFRSIFVELLREYYSEEYADALRARFIYRGLITPELCLTSV